MTLTSDGKEMKLDASLAGHNFAPGYRYVVELGVGRIADNPELDIEILPWNEYDWGDGGIGGGGYLTIDTGGSTLLEPELEQQCTWQEAVDYCRGKGDNWRLPTENELYYYWCVEPSVRVLDPFMEQNYWSSTTNASNAGQAWTFDFGYGIANKKGKTERLYVRCVRDKESGAGTKYPYVKAEGDASLVVLRDAAGGINKGSLFASRPTATLIDTKRSDNNRMSAILQVQRADPDRLNWRPSVDYCDNLRAEGYDDWRLPSQRELMMIWTMGGNEHVESLDIDNSSDSPVQRPVGNARLHSLAGFTVLPDNVLFSATWDEDDPDNYPDITAILRISGTDGRVNTDAIDGDHPRSFRCVRDWNGSAPDYTVSENAVMPAGDIPGEGKTYSLTLIGNIPYSGVDVRATSGGTALVTGKVTASGTAVSLAVPANTTGADRTVTFEYLWNGTWTKIGDARTQQGYKVSAATHTAPATIPGQGGSYNVTLTGVFPAAGIEVRANISGANPVTGKVTASGTAVSLTIPGQLSYDTRTVTFEYNWNGTWTKIGSDCTQQGWHVTKASVSPSGDIPGAGGTYTVTLEGWGGYQIRAVSGSTQLVINTNAPGNSVDYSASIKIPNNVSPRDTRQVTFQFLLNGTWRPFETRTQRASVNGVKYSTCEQHCADRGGIPTTSEMKAMNWAGWPVKTDNGALLMYWSNEIYSDGYHRAYAPSRDSSGFGHDNLGECCRCRND